MEENIRSLKGHIITVRPRLYYIREVYFHPPGLC